ncbi:MAG TPA: glycine--tRNA ligase subunit beta [Anaerolineaceae bacterium]|nr:glycine--tRNA ligase subunit beta [Anaerolineaceae bacterium]
MTDSEHKNPLDFQSIMFALQNYWARQGCLIWQPYYSQVGAGTMNPATFLRVLGPEPWKVAYVEPSVRPDDGRYGINPNRLQMHYQFQVILKPDPGNPQELYLDSLRAIGIDPHQHDIRFVEDNWESPALSAWGLGWEVWLDGQEITQFTYFQQSGGMVLDVPAVEITYGLERIAMALQRVRHFKDIRWNAERTCGDVNQVGEREHSTYYFEVADVPRLRDMFNLFESEANLALERNLVLPAYDYVIKCSHTFNILDTRGAVGFTERQALFGKMRDLSRRVAEAYLAQRTEMGFPWLKAVESAPETAQPMLPELKTGTADLLLEIGTEELPTADLAAALAQLETGAQALLADARLEHGEVRIQGTPRRLALMVRDLQTQQPDRVLEVKGPPAARAFDAQGKPTKAAEGFAKSRGLDVSQLRVSETEGGSYVVAEVSEKGQSAAALLAGRLPELCESLRFTKGMRWNQTGKVFSRPVRWMAAMLDGEVIPFEFAGLHSGCQTRGLRFAEQPTCQLNGLQDYLAYMDAQGIVLDPEKRKAQVWEQAQALAAKVGGKLADDPDLLEEVTNLVERPTAMLGTFEQGYLESLPAEVLIGVMRKHQRYFPVLDQDRNLTQHFIIVRNGDARFEDVVVDGNLQVIHARFADAEFFIREDKQKPLADFIPRLAQLTFQKDLGSMLEKTRRVQSLTTGILNKLGVPADARRAIDRTAELCKADLATAMVIEMTELQGVMGKFYARLSGEPEAVAQGIFEHYLPRNAEDRLPEGEPGLLVGIADRLDSLAGLFAMGLAPTGNKDPFALRRTALGLAQLLTGKNLDFDLEWGLKLAGEALPVPFDSQTLKAALEFVTGRLRGLLLERGYRYDVVDAVLKAQAANPAKAGRFARSLGAWTAREDWGSILPAYSRCARITRDIKETFLVDENALVEAEERRLLASVRAAQARLEGSPDLDAALEAVRQMVPEINGFFDKVLVMAEDEKLRKSRLGLLQSIVALVQPLADLSALEGF